MSQFEEQEKEQKNKPKPTPPVQQPVEHQTVEPQTIQRDLSDVNGPEGGMLPGEVSSKIQSMRGSGQRLSDRQNQFYSQKFGRDMSDVHIHTDTQSDTISRSLNARAFTIGSDVFLTKGINPEGDGRDAQTMTHELTHVVQQGGHASSGPLKLGAADTAQEHEAESTAQREYAPEMESEKDTIQRGFLGALGSTIGHNFLNMVGMEDAYNATYGAKHKVQNAVLQLDEAKQDEFNSNERQIQNYQNRIEEYESQLKTEDGASNEGLINEYTKASQELSDLRANQLKIVKTVDESITDADMIQYRNKKSGKSMILGALGSSIMGGFSREANKGKGRAEGMLAGANYGAGSNAYQPPSVENNSVNPDIKSLQQEIASLKQELAALKGSAAASK